MRGSCRRSISSFWRVMEILEPRRTGFQAIRRTCPRRWLERCTTEAGRAAAMVAISKIDEVITALLALIGFVLMNTTSALVHDSKSDKRGLGSEFRLSLGKTAQTAGHHPTRTLVINDLAGGAIFCHSPCIFAI